MSGAGNVAYHHEDSEDIEDAVRGDTEATDEAYSVSERRERPHACEHCGRKMKYADQRCGCTSKMSGVRW
jgi:hypothetical protein